MTYRLGVGAGLKAKGGKRRITGALKHVGITERNPDVAYRIAGLPRANFERYFDMDDAQLAELGMMRVVACADRGYPCRVGLDDAKVGESLILLNFVSHDVVNPYRTAYAIYVRESSRDIEPWIDAVPPMLQRRKLSLRGFDRAGMLRTAVVADGGCLDHEIRGIFADPAVEIIHAHNAAYGCFAAAIERYGEM